jgi:uncharacterized protein (DUF1800 family)
MFIARRVCRALALAAALSLPAFAQEAAVSLSVTNGAAVLDLPKVPGTQEYRVLGTSDLNLGFGVLNSGSLSGWTWSNSAAATLGFFQAVAVPMPTNDMLAALVLNRLAYGPTPDELERVKTIGADAWIAEQLAPETISESLDIDQVNTSREWQRVVVAGTSSSRDLYIYLTAIGDVYIDDIKLVAGTSPDVGVNVLANPGFETALTPPWNVSTNLTNSYIDTTQAHTGVSSLHIISSEAGSTRESAIWQTASANMTTGVPYTLSYWWKPGTNIISNLTLRLSGSGIVSSPDTLGTRLASSTARIDDLRNWHVQRAVRSKKQLEETLLQFLDNHFVTQVSKTRDYFDGIYNDPFNGDDELVAVNTEYREIQRWRAALEKPTCTFSNLLTISVESPAMIIYLDTVNSRGDGANIPNENYAREVLELFTFGVDNGYDQTDITLLSRVWTGWRVDIVDPAQEFNPLAPRSTTLRLGGTDPANRGHLEGVWALSYNQSRHWNQGGTILFPGKKIPDRFGPPHAGKDYTLGVDVDANISTNWQRVTMTGTATSSTLYMYLSGPGDIYLDDIQIVAGSNPDVGVNMVGNGGFESGLTGWTVSANHASSVVQSGGAHGGANALHMIATEGGSTRDSSIWRAGLNLVSGQTYTLSFWWRPGTAIGSSVTLRLSGSGLLATAPARTAGDGLAEGYKVVGHLSNLPFTQEFISVKLCRLFVHDDFVHGVYDYTDPNLSEEGKLVKACMDAWENSSPKGNIREVLKVIFNSELFRSQGAVAHKVKTPFEFTVSAIRALRSENPDGTATAQPDGSSIGSAIIRMGSMRLFDRAEPDGYPEAAAPWISAGTLAERLRWTQALCIAPGANGHADAGNSTANPVALLKKKLPSSSWNNAGAVADYFLSILLPGEGKANLDLYRTAAINFLNTGDNGTTSSPFANLVNTTTAYDTRVRGMVAAIMTSQRFHEQ